jgi:tartrate dehydrogenase/decarboxylase/D-malate dehydrogenase
MMLDTMGERDAARRLEGAVEAIYARTDTRTPDLGGAATTAEFTRALIALL